MRTREILTVMVILAGVTACGERGEGDEAAESGNGAVEAPAELLARARVTADSARAIALTAVPGGRVSGAELEEEDGALIWSFDIAVDGREGIEEIHVDALTGKVIAHEHEGAAEEAAEGDTARR